MKPLPVIASALAVCSGAACVVGLQFGGATPAGNRSAGSGTAMLGMGVHTELGPYNVSAASKSRVGAMVVAGGQLEAGDDDPTDDYSTGTLGVSAFYERRLRTISEGWDWSLSSSAFLGAATAGQPDTEVEPEFQFSAFLGTGVTGRSYEKHRFLTIALGVTATRISLVGEDALWLIGIALDVRAGYPVDSISDWLAGDDD